MTQIAIEKAWDENERVRESASGRTYVSRGRWQWSVVVDGVTDSVHESKREASDRVRVISNELKDPANFRVPAGDATKGRETFPQRPSALVGSGFETHGANGQVIRKRFE